MTVARAQAEDGAAALLAAGAEAVHLREHPAPSAPPPFGAAAVEEALTTLPMDRAWLEAAWPAVAAEREDLAAAIRAELALHGVGTAAAELALVPGRAEDWSERWRAAYKPQKVGRRLWVVPTWAHDFRPPSGSVVVRLDPGLAFGTGEHATSRLCLRAIERTLAARPAAARARLAVLDVGCGTGILALAALALGAGRAEAIDLDPQAVAVAEQNAAANALPLQPDGRPLEEVAGPFDLVVANLLLGPLVALAGALVARLAPGATLILSGLWADQAAQAREATLAAGAAVGLCLERHDTLAGWSALVFARQQEVVPAT